MTKLTKLHTDAFKNYSYKAKNWRTVMASNVPGHAVPRSYINCYKSCIPH